MLAKGEFKNTFREYPHKKDGIEGYINNKVMNSCVLFHLDGPHKLFEKYIPTYRKKLNMYLNKKTKGKYIAKVDDLSDADATGYNLGVFVIMVKKKKEGGAELIKLPTKEEVKEVPQIKPAEEIA